MDYLDHPHLDFEGPLKSTSKEASKWPNEGGKGGQCDAVDLEGVHPDCLLQKEKHIREGFSTRIALSTSCPSFCSLQALDQLVFKWVNVSLDLG